MPAPSKYQWVEPLDEDEWEGDLPELTDEDREEIRQTAREMNLYGQSPIAEFEECDGAYEESIRPTCESVRKAFNKHIRPHEAKMNYNTPARADEPIEIYERNRNATRVKHDT